ncbi:MAG: hypothetical protein R2828_14345 [Saprospiraceae bacterium]
MRIIAILMMLCFSLGNYIQAQSSEALTIEKAIKKMKWRPIGPANMGGRVTDIVGIPGDPSIFYVAGADGGVFKTTNGGVTFEARFTDQRVFSVGALAIAPSDQEVIWLGSGEGDPRNSVGYGNGVYRSLDGGETWAHLGLDDTERIKRIVVHPDDPDVACVCALGHEWGPNPERGVFRTIDGGQSWEKVLYIDEDTGCSDLAMDPANPRFLYAGMWTFRRKPWRFDDGGKATAPYRSKDGGKTWERMTMGLPDGAMTRIGFAVAASQPSTVYLISEFQKGGTLFRTDNRGNSWQKVNDDPNINFRPFYYSDIRVDPNNPDHLYSLSGSLMKSTDGGKSFQRIANGVHGDHQSLWIDPLNSKRILSGSDGGFQQSFDAGKTWDIINNVELSQFYQLDIDNQDPYNVYGGLQDNGTWVGPSNSLHSAGIMKRHWKGLAGGDGYYAVPIPGSEHEIYANLQGGVIFHVDTRTGNVRNIHPFPKITGSAGDAIEDHKYRFNWDSPIHVSPHDPNTVFFGGNVIFKSTDRGYTWEEISADLTTNDKEKQRTSGGEIYQDNTAAEFHCTILTIAESPVKAGVIWAGTDDGNIQLTTDGGKNWKDVKGNIKGLPKFSWVGKIHASEHDAGTAFVAVDQHRMDDFTPHAYMTTDYGKTWTQFTNGLPKDDYVKVIRQDPTNANLLYIGMEHGIYASFDKGKSWIKINNNLPPVSVRDLRVQKREGDLIVGTHGRGAWILDDMQPLQELATAMQKEVYLFPSRKATRWHYYDQIENLGQRTYAAENPTYGANVNFFTANKPTAAVKVAITDEGGQLVRTLTDTTITAGLNRINWDLRGEAASKLNNAPAGGWRSGGLHPLVPPGTYTATLHINDESLKTKIEVRADPRLELKQTDFEAQANTLASLRTLLSETHEMINNCDQIKEQLQDLRKKVKTTQKDDAGKALVEEITAAIKAVDLQRDELLRPPPSMPYRQRPRLRDEIRSLMWAIDGASARPTQSQLGRVESLKQETVEKIGALQQLINTTVASINGKVRDLPQIMVGPSKP